MKAEEKGDTGERVVDTGVNKTGNKPGTRPDEEEFVGGKCAEEDRGFEAAGGEGVG